MSADEALNRIGRAYEGIESSDSFDDREAVESYRAGLIERTEVQADFVEQMLPAAAEVLEVACGNGRLLVELATRGRIQRGYGTDLAASRIEFANQWASDWDLQELTFQAEDLVSGDFGAKSYDVVACITSALAYFDAARPGLAHEILLKLAGALRPDGSLVLELYPHPRERALLDVSDGDLRQWRELPDDDPWRFYLSRLMLDPNTNVMTHEKTFIHRTSGKIDSGRFEQIVLYDPQSLTDLLHEGGFVDVRTYEGWTSQPYAGGDVLVATARPA